MSSAHAFEVVLIERVPSPAARCSQPDLVDAGEAVQPRGEGPVGHPADAEDVACSLGGPLSDAGEGGHLPSLVATGARRDLRARMPAMSRSTSAPEALRTLRQRGSIALGIVAMSLGGLMAVLSVFSGEPVPDAHRGDAAAGRDRLGAVHPAVGGAHRRRRRAGEPVPPHQHPLVRTSRTSHRGGTSRSGRAARPTRRGRSRHTSSDRSGRASRATGRSASIPRRSTRRSPRRAPPCAAPASSSRRRWASTPSWSPRATPPR